MTGIKGTYKDDKGVVRDIRQMPNVAEEVIKMEAEAAEIDEAETFLEDLVNVKKEDVLLTIDVPEASGWFRKKLFLSDAFMTELERQLYGEGRDRIRARRRRARQASNRRRRKK